MLTSIDITLGEEIKSSLENSRGLQLERDPKGLHHVGSKIRDRLLL
jgi:hypothetical protein